MKIGVVVATVDAETVWSIFRFANVALKAGNTVRIFLLAKGVDLPKIKDPKFRDLINEQREEYASLKGEIIACGTCVKLRKEEKWDYCTIATMKDLLNIVEWADKVLTFSA